jgi:hypothetical protein
MMLITHEDSIKQHHKHAGRRVQPQLPGNLVSSGFSADACQAAVDAVHRASCRQWQHAAEEQLQQRLLKLAAKQNS